MLTCTEHCPGHLGKFDSCQGEALYELTLDTFGDASTGDANDWHYHATLVILDSDADVVLYEALPVLERTVTVPAGFYIVQAMSSGAVYANTYDTEAQARTAFEAMEADYALFDDQDDA